MILMTKMLIRNLRWDSDYIDPRCARTILGTFYAYQDRWELVDKDGMIIKSGDASSFDDARKGAHQHWCDLIRENFIHI